MDGYVLDLRNKYGHLQPKKPQYSPHKHRPINYEAKQQILQPADTSQSLDYKGIKIVQGIVITILYMGRAVKKKNS